MKNRLLPWVLSLIVALGVIGINQEATAAQKAVSTQEFKVLQQKVKALEVKLSNQATTANSVLIPEGYSDLLGYECGRAGSYEREFSIGGKRFFQCRFNFVVGK
jgi:hypothetical protein